VKPVDPEIVLPVTPGTKTGGGAPPY